MGDLTLIQTVMEWLGLTVNDDNLLLARLITAASGFIETYIGYRVASQTYAEVRDGHGGNRLAFGKPPLTAVASVKVDGVAIPAAATVAAAGYRFKATLLWLNGYSFNLGTGNVEVACTRGWAETPADLEQACIELVALRYKERDRIGQVSKSLGDGQTVSFWLKDMPDSVRTVLNAYRKVAPV